MYQAARLFHRSCMIIGGTKVYANIFTFKSCQDVLSDKFSTFNLWSDLGPGGLPRLEVKEKKVWFSA